MTIRINFKFFVKTVSAKVCVKTNSCADVVASTEDELATTFTLNASLFKAVSANLTSKGLSWFTSNNFIWLPLSFYTSLLKV